MKKSLLTIVLFIIYGTAGASWTQPVLSPPVPLENVPFSFEITTFCDHIFISDFGPPTVIVNGTTLNVRFSGLAPLGICTYEPFTYRVDLPALPAGSYRLIVDATWNEGRPSQRSEQLSDQLFTIGAESIPINLLSTNGLFFLFGSVVLITVINSKQLFSKNIV